MVPIRSPLATGISSLCPKPGLQQLLQTSSSGLQTALPTDILRFSGKLTVENLEDLDPPGDPELISPTRDYLPLEQSTFTRLPSSEAAKTEIRHSVSNCPSTQTRILGGFLVNAMAKALYDSNVPLFNWNKSLMVRLLERRGIEIDRRNHLNLTLPQSDFLEGKNLNGIDLSEIALKSADGKPVSLKDCQLREAKCHRSDLRGITLEGSNLEGAIFSNALMQGCNLSWTVIDKQTRFRQTQVQSAQLHHIEGWEPEVFRQGSNYGKANMVPSLYYDRHTVFPEGFTPDDTMCPTGLAVFKRLGTWLSFRNCD